MQCLILAGGLGRRMYPLTETVPKSLVPVHGRPFLGYQLELLASKGLTSVVLSIGHLGQQIRDFSGDGSRFGLKIAYSDEGSLPLGTGGAIRLAFEQGLLETTFFVVYGDSYTDVPFRTIRDDFEAHAEALAIMVVIRNGDRWDRSNVLFEDGQLVVYDKQRRHSRSAEMRHIDYGVSLLGSQALSRLPPGPSDLSDMVHKLSVEGRLAGFEVETRFYEIGSPHGLEDFSEYLKEGVRG